jgi:hypothetical protein
LGAGKGLDEILAYHHQGGGLPVAAQAEQVLLDLRGHLGRGGQAEQIVEQHLVGGGQQYRRRWQ